MESLTSVFQGLHNEMESSKRRVLESKLESLGKDSNSFIGGLVEILSLPPIHKTSDWELIQQSAATYLKTYVQNMLTFKRFSTQQMISYALSILRIAAECSLSSKISQQLAEALYALISTPQGCSDSISNAVLKDLLSASREYLLHPICAPEAYMLCLETVLKVANSFEQYQEVVCEILAILDSFTKEITKMADLSTLSTYLRLNITLLKSKKPTSVLKHYLTNTFLAETLEKCIKFTPDKTHAEPKLILFTEPALNSEEVLKQNALEFLNSFINKVFRSELSLVLSSSSLYTLCMNLCPSILFSLLELCTQAFDHLENILESHAASQTLVKMLILVSNLLTDHHFFTYFTPIKEQLIVCVILALLKTTEAEARQFIENPENAVNLALDMSDRQKSKVVKTQAAKFLEEICDHIDGATTFLFTFCTRAISYACHGKNPEYLPSEIVEKFPLLEKCRSETIIEAGLSAMSVMYYSAIKRNDLLKDLEFVLVNYWDLLAENSSIIVKCRLALIFTHYLDSIFQQDPEKLLAAINFLFTGMFCEGDPATKAFSIQSAYALTEVLDVKNVVARLGPSIGSLVPLLSRMVEDLTETGAFTVIQIVIEHYSEIIDQSILNIAKSIQKRIMGEYDIAAKNGKKNSMVITQCLNLLKRICEIDDYVPEFAKDLESTITPLLEYLKVLDRIDFEEDILEVIRLLIDSQKSVTPLLFSCVPLVLKLYEKYKTLSTTQLHTFASYIIYGKSAFDLKWIEALLGISFAAMEGKACTNGCLLLQFMLQNFTENVLDAYIPGIIHQVATKLEQTHDSYEELMHILMSAICNNPAVVISVLDSEGKIEFLINSIFNECKKSGQSIYTRKVLSLGLTTLLVLQTYPAPIMECFVQLLEALIEVLYKQMRKEINIKRKQDSKETRERAVYADSSSSDDSSSEGEPVSESSSDEMEVDSAPILPQLKPKETKIKRELPLPIKEVDEFEYFKKAIRELKQRNPEHAKALIANLPSNRQIQFKKIMQGKRVAVSTKQAVARRIVKAKHLVHKK